MFITRMRKLKTRAKEELERLRTEDRATTEHLIEVFTDVLRANTDTQDVTEAGTQIRAVLDGAGGTARLLNECEQVSAYHGDRYQPLMWRFYSSHRKALFRVIKTLDVRSTTSDQTLTDAMNFIIAHEHDPKKYLEATIALSFASEKWQRTVLVRRKRKSWFVRQHLETCVFSYLAEELKTHNPGPVLLKGVAARIPVMHPFELAGQCACLFIGAPRTFTDARTCCRKALGGPFASFLHI